MDDQDLLGYFLSFLAPFCHGPGTILPWGTILAFQSERLIKLGLADSVTPRDRAIALAVEAEVIEAIPDGDAARQFAEYRFTADGATRLAGKG